MSKLVRKYFIAIEKAFKNRTNWNTNRKNTLINCKELRGALITKREELLNGVPEWITNGNLYSIEFSLLNTVHHIVLIFLHHLIDLQKNNFVSVH